MGTLSRKHRKNRGARYERRKALQAARHYANQHVERGAYWVVAKSPVARAMEFNATRAALADQIARHWAMTPDDRVRLTAYNDDSAFYNDRFFRLVAAAWRKYHGLGPMSPEEAERAYDEAEAVPMSEIRLGEIVDYALGRS